MSRLRFEISVSLDGYAAGPGQSVDDPLGAGGEQLHEWALKLASWREAHGREGGTRSVDDEIMAESTTGIGATIMGRGMFGGGPGPWSEAEPWNGWWGDEPPFDHPVFVLTHHPRPPLTMRNGTEFVFVTEGAEVALERARDAAEGADVALGGGADVAGQYLEAGLIDEMQLHVVPVLLGGGARLFEGVDPGRVGLVQDRVVEGEGVTHLRFRVRMAA